MFDVIRRTANGTERAVKTFKTFRGASNEAHHRNLGAQEARNGWTYYVRRRS